MPRAVRTTRTEPRTLHRDLPSVVNADEVLNPRTACAKEQPLVCLGSGRRRMAYGAGYPAVSAENPESRRHPIAPACVWRRARAGKRLDPAAAGRCRLRQAAVVPDSRVGSAWRAAGAEVSPRSIQRYPGHSKPRQHRLGPSHCRNGNETAPTGDADQSGGRGLDRA
jgi:hypothetical protein